MNLYFILCLTLFIFINNISYGQNYECDNNFGDCGTPNQSGGGGGGGGSVLISNTDLGDTYQHADDYDDDGIEDSSDNCIRFPNPEQLDRDGDGRGDMCDNCLDIWNPLQENNDADYYGDLCDEDIDNDQILNVNDECPYHWGNDACFIDFSYNNSKNQIKSHDNITNEIDTKKIKEAKNVNIQSCHTYRSKNIFYDSLFLLFVFFFLNKIYYLKDK